MTFDELLQIPDADRDPAWETQLFQALMGANLKLISQEPQAGPDNWPYILAQSGHEATEPAQKILLWLAERGIGLAINPQKEFPDYVFTYGMIWFFKETGFFFKTLEEPKTGSVQFETNSLVHAGPPTEWFLPSYVRKVVRDFFRDQAILRPRILVMSTDQVHYDLAFSLDSLGHPPEAEHEGIAEALSWFLPPHYSLLLIQEEGLPPFSDL